MKVAPSLVQLIPDIFFDTLAYILPASLLFVGGMTLAAPVSAPLVEAYLSLGAAFDRFVAILLGLGLLYILGQLITHFSYELILRPLRILADRRGEGEFTRSDIDWTADYAFIRHKDAALGMEITKRYARTVMSRNNTFVSLLLVIASLISAQWWGALISGIFFLLFLHEAYGQQVFFTRYLAEVTREMRNIEPTPKEEE